MVEDNKPQLKHWLVFFAAIVVVIFLSYFAVKSVQADSRVETIAYGKVVATEWDGQTTTVIFDDNYQLKVNGYIQLTIPEDYIFSYYDDQWHFEGLYTPKVESQK